MRSRSRRATEWAPSTPVSGSRMANSSPPNRATMSVSRALRADDVGRFDERPAAEQVAVGVVDALEAVQIDEQQRQRPAAAHRALGLLAQDLVQVPRVVELGQVVGDRQRLGARDAQRVGQRVGRRLEQPRRSRRRTPATSRAAGARGPCRARRARPMVAPLATSGQPTSEISTSLSCLRSPLDAVVQVVGHAHGRRARLGRPRRRRTRSAARSDGSASCWPSRCGTPSGSTAKTNQSGSGSHSATCATRAAATPAGSRRDMHGAQDRRRPRRAGRPAASSRGRRRRRAGRPDRRGRAGRARARRRRAAAAAVRCCAKAQRARQLREPGLVGDAVGDGRHVRDERRHQTLRAVVERQLPQHARDVARHRPEGALPDEFQAHAARGAQFARGAVRRCHCGGRRPASAASGRRSLGGGRAPRMAS